MPESSFDEVDTVRTTFERHGRRDSYKQSEIPFCSAG